ncbi:hypothetical protein LSAT2_027871 [Lamellibrachia satsuma]|nr:hypothetical protein LSAT2_027871 [Lamellibrachia satsuma]
MKSYLKTVLKWGILCIVVYLLVMNIVLLRWSTPKLKIRSSCVCQSTDTWPQSLPVGHTQLEQYRFLRNMTKSGGFKEIERDQAKYTYNITVVQTTHLCSDVRVRLDEYYDGKQTVGGSCFLALTDSPTERELCSYTDYFNGTYAIWCPSPPTTCAMLTIRRQFADFNAYFHRPYKPLDQAVLRLSVCPWNNATNCVTRGHANNPATWLRSGSSWTVGYVRGEPVVKLLDVKAICDCVSKKFDRIVMAGSSHMRYKFDYLMSNCYGDRSTLKIERKHRTFTVNNTHFYETMYSTDFVPLWEETLLQLNLTRKSIVFLQTGAHDVTNRGIDSILGSNTAAYVRALVDIKSRADKVGFKMVVITSPPYPDHDRKGPRGNRNNYALAALSRLLQDKLSPHCLKVFDEFGVILPQQNNDTRRCGFHYLCRIPGNGTHGYVGTTAFRMLMTDICCA